MCFIFFFEIKSTKGYVNFFYAGDNIFDVQATDEHLFLCFDDDKQQTAFLSQAQNLFKYIYV